MIAHKPNATIVDHANECYISLHNLTAVLCIENVILSNTGLRVFLRKAFSILQLSWVYEIRQRSDGKLILKERSYHTK